MARLMLVLALSGSALLVVARGDDPSDDELKKKPITTAGGGLGDLLRKWHKDGTAAGNVGDWYDNRDREHSPLAMALYPQLRKLGYTEEDRKLRSDWALQPRVLPKVVFGNSSTSAPPELSGSNPRTLYCSPDGLRLLQRQYLGNNLYIYPEHRDHDPGHNGLGDGYGDLFPVNTPYLLISQGSSGSDQPFMHALATTLAAFRPDVKEKLVEAGLLMPTVQMILRSSNGHVKKADDYLTGQAHPTVFEGARVDAVKMARTAQSITLKTIPPLVKLKVLKEDKPEAGRDYFDRPSVTEQHADTPCAVARVWRGHQHKRRLVVSAKGSLDVNKAPLTFKWVLLRGDVKRVTIKPRGKAGDEAEITVAYHERWPVQPGSALESNRVDVGVFAHNGTFYSAPAFVTFFSLDSESRTYDDKGRVVEIGHGMGVTDVALADPAGALAELAKDGLPAKVLALTEDRRKELAAAAKDARARNATVTEARKKRDAAIKEVEAHRTYLRQLERRLAALEKSGAGKDDLAEARKGVAKAREDLKKPEANLNKASAALSTAEAELNKALDARRTALGDGARPFVLKALRRAAARPALWNDHASDLAGLAAKAPRVAEARKRLAQLGVIAAGTEKELTLKPIRPGPGKVPDRLTAFEKAMLEQFHAVVLANVLLPGKVSARFVPNFVDARLTAKKPWREVYHHDGDEFAGWTSYHAGDKPRVTEHTAEGWLVVEKDAKGRPVKARTVDYRQAALQRPAWINDGPLTMTEGDEVITISYAGGKRTTTREAVQKE